MLPTFQLGSSWPEDSHERTPRVRLPFFPSPPVLLATEPLDKQSREQTVHITRPCANGMTGAQNVSHSRNATDALLWGSTQIGHLQIKSLAQQFTLFDTLSVSFWFYSLALPSYSSSSHSLVNLQLNPWAIIPPPSAQNCVLQIQISHRSDFLSVGKKEIDKNISCNCLSGMEERQVFPPHLYIFQNYLQ